MIEILFMAGEIQRRYVIGEDRYDEVWTARHRPLAARLLDDPTARVTLDLPHIPEAPYLEYGATLPAWAAHPELSDHQWLTAYDRPGSARPIYVAWLVPTSRTEPAFLASGAAMMAALTGGGTDGSVLLPEIEAARPEPVLIGGYTPDAMARGAALEMAARLLSESLPCLALHLLGK